MESNVNVSEVVRKSVHVVVEMARAVVEAKRIPEGHLYAAFMATGLGLHEFNTVVNILQKQGICKRVGNELVALIDIPA